MFSFLKRAITQLPQIRRDSILAVALAGCALGSCAPCDGIIGCSADPHFDVSGRMIEWPSGTPVAGVVVDIMHAGGSTRSETDSDGFFSARWEGSGGTDSVRLVVQPTAPYLPYESNPVAVRASSVAGDGTDLGRWVVNPFHAFVGEIRNRKTGSPVPNARISFEPNEVSSAETASITARTDAYGRFVFSTDAPGGRTTLGSLTIDGGRAGLFRTIENFPLPPRFRDEPLDLTGVLGLGPTFGYYVLFYLRGTDRQPIPAGTEVRFARTSGVRITPSTIVHYSQPWGAIALISTPAGAGNVTGDMTVFLPPPLAPEVIADVTLPTTQDDLPVCCITFEVGPSLGSAH